MQTSVICDSRPETYTHIAAVRRLMHTVVLELLHRAEVHDASKLVDPERSVFDRLAPRRGEVSYGSAEYAAALAEMGPALQHHYALNPHHPEHHEHGIHGMSLVDLLEMLCDWLACTCRYSDGDTRHSIEINRQRFGYGDELAAVLLNTLPLLEAARRTGALAGRDLWGDRRGARATRLRGVA
jgi:hypothetical protein